MNNANARSRAAAKARIQSTITRPNTTSPLTSTFGASNCSQGGILYVENGNLKYHGSSGTITTIAVA